MKKKKKKLDQDSSAAKDQSTPVVAEERHDEDDAKSTETASENEEPEQVESEGDEAADDDGSRDFDVPPESPPAVSLNDWLGGAPLPMAGHWALGLTIPALVMLIIAKRVSAYTVDDAFISFRYARNLVNGHGLVYNIGERVEGYTNFLWTLIMAVAIKIGLDPVMTSKVLGAASAVGSMYLMVRLSHSIRPLISAPSIAPWLAATTIVFSGYAVYGLETAFFGFLLLLGIFLFFQETGVGAENQPAPPTSAFPWSGAVFALAGLTRPEAPAFVGLVMLALLFGRDAFGHGDSVRRIFTAPTGFFGKQNLLRATVFFVPVVALVLFRWTYYGHLVPNTFLAKTGNLQVQIPNGINYVRDYFNYAGPVVYLALIAVAMGLVAARRDILAIALPGVFVIAYCILIGGDWMEYFRQMAPFEIFGFILVDVAFRSIVDRKSRVANLALAGFLLIAFSIRFGNLQIAERKFADVDKFWKTAPRGVATWMKNNGVRGEIALGDIGFIGYDTDYPILDTLGLVDPVIGGINRGYKGNFGPEFLKYVFEDKKPRYVIIIVARDCQHPIESGSQFIYRSRQFQASYEAAGKVPSLGDQFWCVFQRKDAAAPPAQ